MNLKIQSIVISLLATVAHAQQPGNNIGGVIGGVIGGSAARNSYTRQFSAQAATAAECIAQAKEGARGLALQACESGRNKNLTKPCVAAGEPTMISSPVLNQPQPNTQSFRGDFSNYSFSDSIQECEKQIIDGAVKAAQAQCLDAGFAECRPTRTTSVECVPVTKDWLRAKGYRTWGQGYAYVQPGPSVPATPLYSCTAQSSYRPGIRNFNF